MYRKEGKRFLDLVRCKKKGATRAEDKDKWCTDFRVWTVRLYIGDTKKITGKV